MLLIAVLVVAGSPIWSGVTLARWYAPFHDQIQPESATAAHVVIDNADPGDVVLAPTNLAVAVSSLTARLPVVVGRNYYLTYLKNDPRFHYETRMLLSSFVNGGTWEPASVRAGLRELGVDIVCVGSAKTKRVKAVIADGYHPLGSPSRYACLAR